MDKTSPPDRPDHPFAKEGANEASHQPKSSPISRGAGHDASRRALFSHPLVVRDLIVGYVDEPWVDDIDFESLRRLPTSFVTPKLRHRIADVIWTARWRDRDLYIIILIEFQRRDERYMAVRQLVYVSLTLLELVEKSKLLGEDGQLPPILPVVLYNGETPWKSPRDLGALFGELPDGLRELQPQFRFLLLEEHRLPVDLEGPANLMAAIAALEQGGTSAEEFSKAILAASRWLEESPEELRRIFYAWITRVLANSVDSDLPLNEIDDLGDLKDMLEERIANWKHQWYAEGVQKGLEEGVQKGLEEGVQKGLEEGVQKGVATGRRLGEAEILKRQLQLKFRRLPGWASARIDEARDEDLLCWADRVLTATSLDEVFAD